MKSLVDLVEGVPFWNEIEPLLYLGSVDAFKDKKFVSKIDAVVSITRIATEDFGLPSRISVQNKNHLDICLADHEDSDISQHFDESYEFITNHILEGHSVFVHCAAGISRSATLVAAYLMRVNKWTAYEALSLLKEKRPCIRPNDGFLEQLLLFEKNLTNSL
jgi:protein-tyrosine phosphatase